MTKSNPSGYPVSPGRRRQSWGALRLQPDVQLWLSIVVVHCRRRVTSGNRLSRKEFLQLERSKGMNGFVNESASTLLLFYINIR